ICKKYGAKAVLELKWTTGINNNDQSKLSGLVELVKSKGMYEDAIFMTSMRNCLTYLRNNFKDIQLQYLTGSSTTTMDNVNWCIENKMSLDAISTHLTQAMVNKMHEAGFYVNAYTVNVQTTADSLQSMGVDMITTDNLGIE
ncbi:MAG: glycerophosphodiester phosphodiesterase, partial [Bacilli bacterium]